MRVGWNFVLMLNVAGVGSVAEMGNRTASVLRLCPLNLC